MLQPLEPLLGKPSTRAHATQETPDSLLQHCSSLQKCSRSPNRESSHLLENQRRQGTFEQIGPRLSLRSVGAICFTLFSFNKTKLLRLRQLPSGHRFVRDRNFPAPLVTTCPSKTFQPHQTPTKWPTNPQRRESASAPTVRMTPHPCNVPSA